MRVIRWFLPAVLVACASGHQGTDRTADQVVRVVGPGGGQVRIRASDAARAHVIGHPVDRTWGALKAVFDSLEIPRDNLDDVQHVIGHSGTKAYRKLGIIPLTRIIDCGSTQGAPSADTYDVQIAVLTHLTRDKSGMTAMTTTVEAVGRPMAFSSEYVRCSTKGELEATLVDLVTARLAAKPPGA